MVTDFVWLVITFRFRMDRMRPGLPYTDLHMDLMAVLMGRALMPLMFLRLWRHETGCTPRRVHRLETDVASVVLCVWLWWSLHTCVDGYQVKTVRDIFWPWDTHTCVSWLSVELLDISEPICTIVFGFMGVLLSKTRQSTNREWTQIQTILSAILRFLLIIEGTVWFAPQETHWQT